MYFKHSSRTNIILKSSMVTTTSFEPTPQYVAEAVKAPAVQAWLKEPKQRLAPAVSIYLVTGMKIAKDANVKYSISVKTATRAVIRTSTGVPLPDSGYGPRGIYIRDHDEETEFKRDFEFIFAFRVKRLRFRHGRDLQIEDFTKGACLESAQGENGSEIASVLLNDTDGSSVGNVSDEADVESDVEDDDAANDADSDNVESIADDFGTGNNAAGTSTQNDTDNPRIETAKLISNVAKNRKLVFKIVENLLG